MTARIVVENVVVIIAVVDVIHIHLGGLAKSRFNPFFSDVPSTLQRHVLDLGILQVNLPVFREVFGVEPCFIEDNGLKIKHNKGNLTQNEHHLLGFVLFVEFDGLGNQLVDGEDVSEDVLEPSEEYLSGVATKLVYLVHPEDVAVFGRIQADVVEVRHILQK